MPFVAACWRNEQPPLLRFRVQRFMSLATVKYTLKPTRPCPSRTALRGGSASFSLAPLKTLVKIPNKNWAFDRLSFFSLCPTMDTRYEVRRSVASDVAEQKLSTPSPRPPLYPLSTRTSPAPPIPRPGKIGSSWLLKKNVSYRKYERTVLLVCQKGGCRE